jgi:hypothetical protein
MNKLLLTNYALGLEQLGSKMIKWQLNRHLLAIRLHGKMEGDISLFACYKFLKYFCGQ